MRPGCHSLVFGALDAVAALDEIASAGFDSAVVAQIAGQAQHAASLPDVRRGAPTVVAVDAATHEIERGGVAIAHTARLGVGTALVAPGGRPGAAPRTRVLSDNAAAHGLRLAVVPRARSAVPDAETALSYVRRFPHVALWPDTSHLARAGDDLVRAAQALAPYAAGWFVRDHDGASAGPGAFDAQVPGRGALPLHLVVAALRGAGFDGPLVFHAIGHLPRGAPSPDYPLDRLRVLAREARDYLADASR